MNLNENYKIDAISEVPIMQSFRLMQDSMHNLSTSNGFWGEDLVSYNKGGHDTQLVLFKRVALIQEELGELTSAIRSKEGPFSLCDKEGLNLNCIQEELSDIMIRTMDLAEFLSIDLGKSVVMKHNYNCNRPFKHGKTA